MVTVAHYFEPQNAPLLFGEYTYCSQHKYSGRFIIKICKDDLKVVSGQTNWGSKVGSIDRYWYRTVALDVKKIWGLVSGS